MFVLAFKRQIPQFVLHKMTWWQMTYKWLSCVKRIKCSSILNFLSWLIEHEFTRNLWLNVATVGKPVFFITIWCKFFSKFFEISKTDKTSKKRLESLFKRSWKQCWVGEKTSPIASNFHVAQPIIGYSFFLWLWWITALVLLIKPMHHTLWEPP